MQKKLEQVCESAKEREQYEEIYSSSLHTLGLSEVYTTTYLRSSTSSSKIKESLETATKAKVEKILPYYQSEDPLLDITFPQSKTELSGMVSDDPEGYSRSITSSSKIKENKKTSKAEVEKSSPYYQSEDPFPDITSQTKTGMISEDPEG